MKLRTRLFVLVGSLVAMTVVLVTATVSSAARRSFATLDAERSSAAVARFRRQFQGEADQVVQRLERAAASDRATSVASGIGASRDYAPFVQEAAAIAAEEGLDFLDLVAADGTLISSAHFPARFGYPHAWAIAAASHPGAFLQAVELPNETALGLVTVRHVTSRGAPLYLAGGRWLDRRFLASLALPPGMRALLYRNTQPEVSRQFLVGEEIPDAAPLEPLIARVRQSGRDARETIEWPDYPETFDALPLSGRGNGVAGVLLVGSSGRELATLVSRVRWSGIGYGALVIAIGFAATYVVAARVTRPVEQLATAAHRVEAGEWDVRLDDLRASGEVKALADAFDGMTRQLVDHRDRLLQAERVASWRELARRLAHELKNPLFPLRVTLDNLRRARALPPAEFDEVFDESVGTLTTGLSNLNTVVGRFSDFARMPAPELARISPNAVVEQSVALFRAQLSAPGCPPITATVDLDPTVEAIRGDGEQIGRAVQNLLLNAIDAMPTGGTLTVRTRRLDRAVGIDISDSGQGMNEDERSRVFTPYYTTKQHGTGLGLAIVQAVVADHGGKITVDSAPGRGATFHIELPCGDEASA